MAKLTLHRALAELKLLDSKITKKIDSLKIVGYKKEDGLVDGNTEAVEFNNNAKSTMDSIRDLLKRKSRIKSAIVKANATTTVTVAGEVMTISDAITKKNNVHLDEALLDHLSSEFRRLSTVVERHNYKVDQDALELIKVTSGKEGDTSEQSKIIGESFKKTNSVSLVDPLGVEDLIKELETNLDDFKSEVDAVLSEANAVTTIEIED